MFAKVSYHLQELIAEDDRVAARYVVEASPRLAADTPAPPVVVNGVALFKIAGGKIREIWIMNDQLNLLRQLGFTVTPPPATPPRLQSLPAPASAPPP